MIDTSVETMTFQDEMIGVNDPKSKREPLRRRLFSASTSVTRESYIPVSRHIRNFEELVALLGDCWSTCLASRDVGGFLFVRSERKCRILNRGCNIW